MHYIVLHVLHLEDCGSALLIVSAIYRFPAESTATLSGALSCALVAGPLSALNPDCPFPAIVVITPLETCACGCSRCRQCTGRRRSPLQGLPGRIAVRWRPGQCHR